MFRTTVTHRTDYAIKMYVREVIDFYSKFFRQYGQFVQYLGLTDYLNLKVADLTFDL